MPKKNIEEIISDVKEQAEAVGSMARTAGEKAVETAKKTAGDPNVQKAIRQGKETVKKTAKAVREAIPSDKVILQYGGSESDVQELVDKAKKQWKETYGGRGKYIRSFTLYLKPEEGMAYDVVNGKETGSVEL